MLMNLVANLQQLHAWIARDLEEGKETAILPLPLYHVYALTSNLVFMKIGAHVILITNPRDVPGFVHELKRHKFTVIIRGPTRSTTHCSMRRGSGALATHGIKVANAGGMAVQRAVAEKWKQVTGVPLVESYGLTETSPGAISNTLDITEWTGTIGVPIPLDRSRDPG